MSLLSANSVAYAYGAKTVLASVDFSVGPGDRLAVVGPNGVGKSTLLRLLVGLEQPESGSVSATGTVGLLPQERDLRPAESVSDYLARRTGVAAADRALDAAALALGAGEPGAEERYSTALDSFLSVGGGDLAERAGATCAELGVPADLERMAGELSGGQRARLALAATMLARFDALLLDEPGNDLDLPGLEMLESYLAGLRGALVIVSHDRALLGATVTEVLSIDPHSRLATVYGGGFDAYIEELERDRARQWRQYEEYADKRNELVTRAREHREWARSGAARANNAAARIKEPDKNIRYARRQGAERSGAKAGGALRRLERLEEVEQPRKEWELRLSLSTAQRSGDVVATMSGAVAQRGGFQLGPVDLQVNRGDRIAVLGPNGSGKSTLVELLLGRIQPVAGRVTLGAGVVIGELGQGRHLFGEDAALLESFRELTELTEVDARTLLAKFGLGAEDVPRPVGLLSPGERTRAGLALLMHRRANLLVMDEPTNHLDLPAIMQLEQALEQYEGTLILITHDRRFLENVGINAQLELSEGAVVS